MAKFLQEHEARLSPQQRRKATTRLSKLLREQIPGHIEDFLETATQQEHAPSEFTGYVRFSFSALRAMVTSLASEATGIFKTKLLKELWYADFLHYRYYSVSISGATYIHLPLGPVPQHYDLLLSCLLSEGTLAAHEVDFGNGVVGECLVSDGIADQESLPDSAIAVLSAVREHFKKLSSKEASQLSHEEDGYKETKNGQPISYTYAERLKVAIPIETG